MAAIEYAAEGLTFGTPSDCYFAVSGIASATVLIYGHG